MYTTPPHAQGSQKHWIQSVPQSSPKDGGFYTSDDVIDAYLRGTKVGADREMRLIRDRFKTNIDLTAAYAHELFEYLVTNGFSPISSYLRINNFDSYNILFTIPGSKFNETGILDLYDYFFAYQDEKLGEFFHFSVSLCGSDKELNESKISADGFTFKLR
jgi:hypothetical protein